jgi:hypothetical protein
MAVLRGKFKPQVNELKGQKDLKLLKKQEQIKSKTNRRRKTIKIRAKINEIQTKITKQKADSLKK